MAKRLLVEGYNPAWLAGRVEQVEVTLPASIVEREGGVANGKPVVRTRVIAQIQECDIKNQNGRRYPGKLWQKVFDESSEFQQRLKNREVLAEVEHPESGNTHLGRVSHLWERVWMDGPRVMGSCIILETPEGKKLKELLEVGHPLGFSSRGRGETYTAADGIEEVKEDYFLDTFDAVAKPSVESARTHSVSSGQESFQPADRYTESIREESAMTANAGIGNAAQYLGRVEHTMAGVLESLGETRDITRLVEAQASVSGLLAEMGATSVPTELREAFAEARGKLQSTSGAIKARLGAIKTGPARKAGQKTEAAKPAGAAVIETLMERNRALTERARKQQRPVVDDKRFEVSIQLGEELLGRARKLQKENAELKERYEAACELMEALVGKQKNAKVKSRVKAALTDSVIRNNPTAKKLLESCKSPEDVDQAVKLISSLVQSRRVRDPLPPLGGRTGRLNESTGARAGLPVAKKKQFSESIIGRLAAREASQQGLTG